MVGCDCVMDFEFIPYFMKTCLPRDPWLFLFRVISSGFLSRIWSTSLILSSIISTYLIFSVNGDWFGSFAEELLKTLIPAVLRCCVGDFYTAASEFEIKALFLRWLEGPEGYADTAATLIVFCYCSNSDVCDSWDTSDCLFIEARLLSEVLLVGE